MDQEPLKYVSPDVELASAFRKQNSSFLKEKIHLHAGNFEDLMLILPSIVLSTSINKDSVMLRRLLCNVIQNRNNFSFGSIQEMNRYFVSGSERMAYVYKPIFNGLIDVNCVGSYDDSIAGLLGNPQFFRITFYSSDGRTSTVVDAITNFDMTIKRMGLIADAANVREIKSFCLDPSVIKNCSSSVFYPKIFIWNEFKTFLNLEVNQTITTYGSKDTTNNILKKLTESQKQIDSGNTDVSSKFEALFDFIQRYDKETLFMPYLYLGWLQNSFLAWQNRNVIEFQPYLFARGHTQSGKSSMFNLFSSFYGLPSCLSSKEISSDFRTLVLFNYGWASGISEVEGLLNGKNGMEVIETLKSVATDPRGRGTGTKDLERLEALNFGGLAFFSNEAITNPQFANLLNRCVDLNIQTKHVTNKNHIIKAWSECTPMLKNSYEIGLTLLRQLEMIDLKEYKEQITEYVELIMKEIKKYEKGSLIKKDNVQYKLEISEREAKGYALTLHGLKTVYDCISKNKLVVPEVKENGHKLLLEDFFGVDLKKGVECFVEKIIIPSKTWDYNNVAKLFGQFLMDRNEEYENGEKLIGERLEHTEKRKSLQAGLGGVLILETGGEKSFYVNRGGFEKFKQYCQKNKIQLTDDFSGFHVQLTNELNKAFPCSSRSKDDMKNKHSFYRQRAYCLTLEDVITLAVGRTEDQESLTNY